MHLTHFVNSGQLAYCIAQEGILLVKTLLDQVVHPLEFFYSAIILYT